MFEEGLASKDLQIEVARRKLVQTNIENVVLRYLQWRECEDLPLMSFPESVQTLGWGSGQQKVVGTQIVVGDTVVNVEKDDEEEHLRFL